MYRCLSGNFSPLRLLYLSRRCWLMRSDAGGFLLNFPLWNLLESMGSHIPYFHPFEVFKIKNDFFHVQPAGAASQENKFLFALRRYIFQFSREETFDRNWLNPTDTERHIWLPTRITISHSVFKSCLRISFSRGLPAAKSRNYVDCFTVSLFHCSPLRLLHVVYSDEATPLWPFPPPLFKQVAESIGTVNKLAFDNNWNVWFQLLATITF